MNKKLINGKIGLCLLVVFFALLAFQSAMAVDCTVSRISNGDGFYTVTITPADGGNTCILNLDDTSKWYGKVKKDVGGGSDVGLNTKVTIGKAKNVTVYLEGADSGMFDGFKGITDWSFLDQIKVDNMTSLASMFSDSSLDSEDSTDKISGLTAMKDWNVENVQTFSGMFGSCYNITTLSSLSGWTVSSGINFATMFNDCQSLQDVTGIKGWNVSSTASYWGMFYGVTSNFTKADFSSWTINKDDCDFFLFGVSGAAVKLNQYYTGMEATKPLYVFGKHSLSDLTNNSTDDNSVLVFEPYSVAVYFQGGDGTETASIISTDSITSADVQDYYNAICDAFPNDEPVCPATMTSDSTRSFSKANATVTMNFTLPEDSDPITSVIAIDKNGKKKTLTANAGIYSLTMDTSYKVIVQIGGAPASTGSGIIAEQPPLPEDEIGTYSFDEDGNKFYIQFHTYDICMNYMGSPDACANTSMNLYNDQRLLNGEYAQ